MNKHCFRLIFSKTLGFLIPVAEISTAQRKPGQTLRPAKAAAPTEGPNWSLKALPFALLGLLPNAYADIIVDPGQQTSMTNSSNGVPVVEIADPNSKGLSHNRFNEFNVSQPGLIFNNSMRDGVSQIGGQVIHNPNLTREASAILTEVTGNGSSNLAGALEVFGGRADILIANPNGVTLNGVTTYNTNGLTVSTGRLIPNTLQFAVDELSGRVVIGAGGVNTENLSFFDIVARGIDLNGEVGSTSRSTDIKAVTGLNTYDAQNRTHKKNADSGKNAPQVAIAGDAAGAMHGRFINLISTETGAGVSHKGLIRAAQDITVSAAGDITLNAMQAGRDAAVTSTASITLGDGKDGNGANIGGRLKLKAGENIAINNDVQTDRFRADAKALRITAATLNAAGKQQDGDAKAITLNVGEFALMGEMTLYLVDGQYLSPHALVTENGKLQLQLSGGRYSEDFILKTNAKLVSGGGIDITAKDFTNHEGIIQDNSTRGITINADRVVNSGLVQTKGDLKLTTKALQNLCAEGASLGDTNQTICGGFFAAGNGDIKADLLTSETGLVAGKNMTVELGENTHTIGQYGGIGAGQNLLIKSADGQKASLNLAGELTAGRNLNVALDAMDAAQGARIIAGRNTDLQIANAFSNGGDIRSGGKLTVAAHDVKNTATANIQAGSTTTIKARNSLINEKGTAIVSAGDFSMTSGGDMTTGATINVMGDNALISADGQLTNAQGSIITTKNMVMKSGGTLTNEDAALIYTTGTLTLESVGDMLNNKDALISAGEKLYIKAGGTLTNSDGSFIDSTHVAINAQKLVNQGDSEISGFELLEITTDGDIVNEDGAKLYSDTLVNVTAGGALINDNASINAATVKVKGTTVTNRNKGEFDGDTVSLTATDTLTTESDSIIKADRINVDATYIKGSNSSILAKDHLEVTTREILSNATLHSKNTATLNSKPDEDLLIGAGFKSPTAANLLTVNTRNLTVDGSLKTISELIVNATGNIRNNGEIIGGQNLTINAGGSLDNLANRLIWSAKNAYLNVGTILTNGSGALLRATQNLTVKAKIAVINQAGRIDAGGNVAINTARLENRGEVAGDVRAESGYVHTDNWYAHDWGPIETQYNHTEFWTPRYSGDQLVVKQGVIKAGGDLLLNQGEANNTHASVLNLGGLLAAAGAIKVDGDVTNIGLAKSISLADYMKASSAYARWTVSSAFKKDGPELHTTIYDLFDKNLLAADTAQVIQGGDDWVYSLRKTSTPEVNALFSAVFGADWKNLNHGAMRDRWAAFKAGPVKTMDFYADKQAEISAGGDYVHTGGSLTNGSSANWGKNRTVDVQIGDEKLVTVDGDLDALYNRDSAFDLNKDTDLPALRDAINAATLQEELMHDNPLFSLNPPPKEMGQVDVDGSVNPVNGGFKGVYPLYTSRVSFDPKDFVGSEYLFQKLGYNPEQTVTVLGDAYFDNELIVRTIEHTVGNFFAVKHQLSGNTLVQNLMDNAATQASKLGLIVGQALTKEQYENLESDIVWYEPQVVNGVSVLAPKVYVSKGTLAARQNNQNSGGMITANNVLIDATAVNNVNGVISSNNDTLVYAKGDINNVSTGGADTGIYSGEHGRLVTAAEGEVVNQGGNLQGFEQTVVGGKGVTSSATTAYDDNGNLYVRDNGKLGAGMTTAGTDAQLEALDKAQETRAAAATAAAADAAPDASNETTAAAQKPKVQVEKPDVRAIFELAKQQSKAGALAADAKTSVTVLSGGNLDLIGAQTAADKVTLQAVGDVNMRDIHEVGSAFSSEYSKGFLSSRQVDDTSAWAASKGNQVDANQLTVKTGSNFNITGGALNALSSDIKVAGDMTVAAAKDLAYQQVVTKTMEFVVGAGVGAGGHEAVASWGTTSGGKTHAGKGAAAQELATNGSEGQRAVQNANAGRGATTGATFKIGMETVTSTDTTQAKKHTNAQLNLGSGTVDVGETFDFGGADINKYAQLSAQDRADIAAGNATVPDGALPTLAVTAGDIKTTKFEDTTSKSFDKKTIFAGLMGEAHSSVLDVATNIANRAQKATDGMKPTSGEAGDDALNVTLIAAEAVGNATQLAMGELAGASTTLGVKITNEHSDSKSTQQNVNQVGGNISMTTTKGDIDLNGVNIAGGKVVLDSAGALNQTAAKSTSQENSKSDTYIAGLTTSVGVTAKGEVGVGLSAGASGSHDREETSTTSYTNGLIAGTDVSIKTKGDHNMVGANIKGNAVDLDIAGKQTITSVQDTSNMDHERGSWSVSAGVAWDLKKLLMGKFIPDPTGSASASGGKDYDDSATTKMQSGIEAGKLNLHVAGNQNLTGAHIINHSGQGAYKVDGTTTATELTDTRDKDGGYGGGGGGISRNGVAGVTIQAGRVDQVRYNADQHSCRFERWKHGRRWRRQRQAEYQW